MKIIIGDMPKTTPAEIIQNRINEYYKKGRELRTQVRDDKIELYYIEELD